MFCAVDLLEKERYLILRNAKIDMYKGSMRIAVNNWGKVEVTEPEQRFEPKVRQCCMCGWGCLAANGGVSS